MRTVPEDADTEDADSGATARIPLRDAVAAFDVLAEALGGSEVARGWVEVLRTHARLERASR